MTMTSVDFAEVVSLKVKNKMSLTLDSRFCGAGIVAGLCFPCCLKELAESA